MRLLIALVCSALACVMALTAPAPADEPGPTARLAVARQIAASLMSEDRISQITDRFMPAIMNQMQAQGLPATALAQLGVKQVVREEIHGLVEATLDDLAATYAQAFTLPELIQIEAFYTTPVGQKVLLVEPQLMNAFLPKVAARVTADLPNLRAKLAGVYGSLPQAGN